MSRRTIPLLIVLLALAACGGGTAGSGRSVADPTATTAPRASAAPSVAAAAPTAAATVATARPSAAAQGAPGTTPAASAGGQPSATPRPLGAAPSAPAGTPQPLGTVPPGWKVYRGAAILPFVIAYPPDWTFDDSLLPEQRIVYFYGPDGRDDLERIDIEIGQTRTGADIDVQRDVYFNQKSDFCDKKGIEYTEHRQIAGVAFAILGATCDASNELSFMQVASGLKNGDEWNIQMRTRYGSKEARLREIFNPMLASLNVYGKAP